MLLVGDIGEIEELAEGTGHGHQFLILETAQHLQQLRAGAFIAVTRRTGQQPYLLHALQQVVTFSRSDYFTEQRAQCTDVGAKAGVVVLFDDIIHCRGLPVSDPCQQVADPAGVPPLVVIPVQHPQVSAAGHRAETAVVD